MLAKKAERLNFSSIKNRTEYPDFLDIQGFFPVRDKIRRKRR